MTITVENAGTLAQIYSVGLLILAVEGRFLRDWGAVARAVYGTAGFLSLIVTSVATVALAQAVMFGEPLEGAEAELVRVAGWALCVTIGGFLGGALIANTELLGPNVRREKARQEQLMLAIEAAVTHSLRMRDLDRDGRTTGHARDTRVKKSKREAQEANGSLEGMTGIEPA